MSIREIPDEINVHHDIWGKDADEVYYDNLDPCPICESRIDEFGYCACGGNLGIS